MENFQKCGLKIVDHNGLNVLSHFHPRDDLFLVLTTSFPEVAADIWQLATLQPEMQKSNHITTVLSI